MRQSRGAGRGWKLSHVLTPCIWLPRSCSWAMPLRWVGGNLYLFLLQGTREDRLKSAKNTHGTSKEKFDKCIILMEAGVTGLAKQWLFWQNNDSIDLKKKQWSPWMRARSFVSLGFPPMRLVSIYSLDCREQPLPGIPWGNKHFLQCAPLRNKCSLLFFFSNYLFCILKEAFPKSSELSGMLLKM